MASRVSEPEVSYAALVSAVVDGRSEPSLRTHLDVLLRWMAAPESAEAEPVARGLRAKGVQSRHARRMALMLLDEMLFAKSGGPGEQTLGLQPGASATRIRARYHLLMRVYHPDLADGDSDWLHDRADRIIRAYARTRTVPQRKAPARTLLPPPRRRGRRRASRSLGLRSVLGEARVFRRRALVALVGACLVLIAHTCVANRSWQRWAPEPVAATPSDAAAKGVGR